jgi:hypothetical protein
LWWTTGGPELAKKETDTRGVCCNAFTFAEDVKMLYSVDDTSAPISHTPHEKDYKRWRARLTDGEYTAIEAELLTKIGGSEIVTSSWVPGSDWTGTPFEPIYTKACEYDEVASALCFGLFSGCVCKTIPTTGPSADIKKMGSTSEV